MGKIQKRPPCNIHSSCLVCFMNEKQLSVRRERGRCSYQRETFFFFLIEKLHLESPWLCLLQRLLIVTIYSGHDKVLTHSPFGDPSTLNRSLFSVLSEIHHSQSLCGPCSRDDRYNVSITVCSLIFCSWGVEKSSLHMQK